MIPHIITIVIIARQLVEGFIYAPPIPHTACANVLRLGHSAVCHHGIEGGGRDADIGGGLAARKPARPRAFWNRNRSPFCLLRQGDVIVGNADAPHGVGSQQATIIVEVTALGTAWVHAIAEVLGADNPSMADYSKQGGKDGTERLIFPMTRKQSERIDDYRIANRISSSPRPFGA